MLEKYNKYIILIVFLILSYLAFLLIKPFIPIILGSLILAYAFYPLYYKLNIKLKKPSVASALTTVSIFLIIVLPLIFILNVLTLESISAYQSVTSLDIPNLISKISIDEKILEYLQEIVDRLVLFLVQLSSKLVLSIPNLALNFFLLFFLVYYLLKDGKVITKTLKHYFPISNSQPMYSKFERLTKVLIYGTILIAIIQGILGSIGFLIFGIQSPILWGVAMAIASFIPLIGTALVWLPAGIISLIQGNYVSGIGIILFGTLIIGMVDNFVRPYLVSSKAKVHPVIVFLGVLGGLQVFGFTGIIIGPLLLAIALEFIKPKEVQ
jgi:predicted PurR-regulated permease PerM